MVTAFRPAVSWPEQTATTPPLLAPTPDLLDALGYGPQVWVAPEGSTLEFEEDDNDKPIRYEGISSYTGY